MSEFNTSGGLTRIARAFVYSFQGLRAAFRHEAAFRQELMVAVALLPPTATMGMLLGAGHTELASGAMLLLAVNVVCVLLSAMSVFLLKGVKPRTWLERTKAKQSLDGGAWDRSIGMYKALQTRYPFGRYTEQSMLDISYAYFRRGATEEALSTLDRFIRTYPAHPSVDYAYYLKGLVNYEQNLGFLEKMMPSRVADRDQSRAEESFMDFAELIRRFPDSRYVPDARQRMVFLRNNLAAYEVIVAEYYMRREAYIAAANRARYALEIYPNTPSIPEALVVLHKAYIELELPEGADIGSLRQALSKQVPKLSAMVDQMMFAIDAGGLLVAVDEFSNYPAEALELPNELSGFEPNVEAIAAYEEAMRWAAPQLNSRVIGLSANTYDLAEDEARRVVEEAGVATGLPSTDPVRFGAEALAEAVEEAWKTSARG